MSKIKCQVCEKEFSADKKQQKFIDESIAKGMKMVMLTCKICTNTFPLNISKEVQSSNEEKTLDYRCPVQACTGYTLNAKNITDFEYGCGECGTTWKTKSDLINTIENIIKKFEYRKAVYKFDKKNILPVSPADEPANYEDKVRSEWGK